MSGQHFNGNKSYIASEALAAYVRVKKVGATDTIAKAGDGEAWIGVTQGNAAINDSVAVRLRNDAGTFLMTAAGAITKGASAYEAAAGKIASTGTNLVGVVENASTADGDIIEVMQLPNIILPSDATVTPAKLSASLEDLIPYLAITTTPGSGSGSASIQAKDANGNNLAQRFSANVWIGSAAYAAATAVTGLTASTGTILQTITANALLEVISDANGVIVAGITAAAGTYHVMAQVNGRVYTASVVIS